MTATYREYNDAKKAFVIAHMEHDMKIHTSSLDENNSYHKEYCFDDGSTFYEVMTREFNKVPVLIHGIEFSVNVELLKTEFWSSDDSVSRYYYEKV